MFFVPPDTPEVTNPPRTANDTANRNAGPDVPVQTGKGSAYDEYCAARHVAENARIRSFLNRR